MHSTATAMNEVTALESCARALELAPQDVDCLVEYADALRALGRAREALLFYQDAIKLDPQHVVAHNNLGNAFLELQQYSDAVACYHNALRLSPSDAKIHCNLGQAMRDLGRRQEAATAYSRAVALDPTRADSHWSLGCVLFELKRVPEAMACYAQALTLEPNHAPALLSRGIALRQQRRPEEAEASCRAALAIEPNYVEALSLLGELRADRGQFADAEELFKQTLAIRPDFSFAYFSIATHRKMTIEDVDWLDGAQGLLAQRPRLADQISLRYALGKYFDDIGRHAIAFGHFREANELTKRYGAPYQRDKFAQRVDQIIAQFNPAFIDSHKNRGVSSDQPVFVIGMPRSGTSLTEQILASHPSVNGAGEVPFWNGAYGVLQRLERDGQLGAAVLPNMADDYMQRLSEFAGAARIVDKMPANFLYAGLIHAALPRARIIHMQRHPIDTCLSIYFQNFFGMGPYANDLDNLAHYYREYRRVMNHWRSLLPGTVLLDIPYESLIEDQEGWTRRMLDFVGLPWNPRCLDFHQTDRVVITASKWQVRQKIHSGSAGRWKHYEQFVGPLLGLLNSP